MRIHRYSVIDGLKGIAIIGILLFHVSTATNQTWSKNWENIFYMGRQGIIFFFLVSGYSSSRFSKQRYLKDDKSVRTPRYLIRKFFRISPLYYLILFISIFLTKYWFLPGISTADEITPINILLHLTYLHGLFPKYFLSIVQVAWILGIEAYFYVSSLLLFRLKNSVTKFFILILSMAASLIPLFLLSSLFSHGFESSAIVWWENSPLVYFVFYFSGYLIGDSPLLLKKLTDSKNHWASGSILLVSAITFITLVLTGHRILANFAIISIFLSCLTQSSIVKSILASRLLTKTGIYSFALFLTHQIVSKAILNYIMVKDINLHPLITLTGFFILIYPISMFISSILYKKLEIPGIKLGNAIAAKIT